MGALGGGNGNGDAGNDSGRDAGGVPDGELPGLPPEWGSIVIPDDPAELAEEAAAVRAELRRGGRRRRWPRWPSRARRRAAGRGSDGSPVKLPALLLALALFAAFAGLLTLGYGARRPAPGTGTATRSVPSPLATAPATAPRTVPALDIVDPAGRAVALRSLLPAVVLLVDGCACDELIVATDRATPAGANVVVVARTAPKAPAAAGARVRPVADPAGELRAVAGLPAAAERPAALLAKRSASIVRLVPAVASVDEFRADLAELLTP